MKSIKDFKFQAATLKEEALKYHSNLFPGKIRTKIKPVNFKNTFELAYTPGVGAVCEKIQSHPDAAYQYTNKGNTVAVITNATAVLGFGKISTLASKPVMEGKAMLLKALAGIDSFDIEIDEEKPKNFVNIVTKISKGFGAILLEDIAAPSCFEIEKDLIKQCDIPVMHDDQHGTSIVLMAALINALLCAKKKLPDCKIVILGAGAAAIRCAEQLVNFKADLEKIYMFDSVGLVLKTNQNPYKAKFGKEKKMTLQDAMKGSDIFIGLSKGNLLTKEHIAEMTPDSPIIFALANPTPEIDYQTVVRTHHSAIYGSGRSDNYNQINNVLAFPFIFRAVLDTQATKITKRMKEVAIKELAKLGQKDIDFSRYNLLPKAFDPKLIYELSKKIAECAIKEGVNRKKIPIDYEGYIDNILYEDSLPKNLPIPVGKNEEAFNICKFFEYRGLRKQSEKEFYVVDKQTLLSNITISSTVYFKTFELNVKSNNIEKIIKKNIHDLIGVKKNDTIFFNNEIPAWYAHKLF